MAKRNWDDVSDTLATILDAPIAPKISKRPCYDISKTDIVYKTTNKYLYDKFYHKNINTNKKIYYFRNNINLKDVMVCQDDDVTIRSLSDYFKNIGHCLAYKISNSYVTKLMFDFDCYKCKKNACNSLIESEMLNIIHDDVCNFIRRDLKDNTIGCVIFKKANTCNLHLYFNVSVSIPMLELLRKRLMSHLSNAITDKYVIDDVYILDLPYSTKNGHDIYMPVYNTANFDYMQMSCLPNETKFYDIELKLSIDEVYDTYITLGSFKSKYNSEWNENTEYVKYLITPLEFNPLLVKNENSLIINIKLSNIDNFVTTYSVLEQYLKPVSNNDEQFETFCDFVNLLSEDEKKIFNGLLSLGDILGKKLYNSDNKVNNILAFITMKDCTYAFYVVCSIIFHLYSINTSYTLEYCKMIVIKILILIVKHSNQCCNDVLLQTLNSINDFDCISNMNHVFEKPDEWFKYLMSVVKLGTINANLSLNEKRVNLITLQLKVYNTLDMIITELVELCKLLIPIIKIEYGMTKFYYYVDDGIYIPITSDKVFNQHTIQIQMVEALIKKMLQKLVDNRQLAFEIKKQINMKDVWISYFESLNIINPKFNFYDYFISTDLGVFNTLTGLYMSHIPLLYMNTQKGYCRVPTHIQNVKTLSMSELNNHIVKETQNQMYANTLKVFITEQYKLFYGSVMIPGLLRLNDTLYDKKQECNMMKLIYETIIQDTNVENDKLIYFTEVLIVKYKLCINMLIRVAEVIQKNLEEFGEFSRDDLNRYCITNGIEIRNLQQFTQDVNKTLFDQLSVEKDTFKSKLFALAVVMGVFEVAHTHNRKLIMFEWINENCMYVLSKNNLFYNINDCNLSMKSFDNVKRVLEYLIPNDNIPEPLLNLINTISVMLSYDSVMIEDFLNIFSMIYHHNSKRKKVALLIGSPNSGKSTYQHMLFDIHGRSIYSVSSIIQAEGQGPSPEIINALSSYLFSVIEIKSMTSTTIKGMISGDVTHKRLCHQNDMVELKPLSFAIAAANNLPNIYQADEAIRDRLAPFLFKSIFINECEIDKIIDDNVLLARVCNYMISTTKFQIPGVAREFSNILYEQFKNNRDVNGLIQPKINKNNKNSQKLINQILIKNNILYYILHSSNIIFDDSLFITYESLQDSLAAEIEKYNDTTKKKKFNWNFVRSELSLLFKHREAADGSGIRGIGLKSDLKNNKSNVNWNILTYSPGAFTLWTKIKSHLYHVEKLTFTDINNIFNILVNEYNVFYNVNKKGFRDYKLING